MVFPFPYNKATGSDHIKAVCNGLHIELSDVELINETEDTDPNGFTGKSSTAYFKGQRLICDFGKDLSGEVFISAISGQGQSCAERDITMDREAFNDRFYVTTKVPEEAFYILTPHMMEYIL